MQRDDFPFHPGAFVAAEPAHSAAFRASAAAHSMLPGA
jgi:hypothetical protein